MNFAFKYPQVVAVAGLVAVAALWLSMRGAQGMGKDIGQGAGELVGGMFTGVLTVAPVVIGETANGFGDWALTDANPLRPVGEWLGGTVYDIFN